MKKYLQLIAVTVASAIVAAGTAWNLKPNGQVPPQAARAPQPSAPIPIHPQLPRMQVIAQYGGPLQDTLIQRLRDPIDGTTCYLYLPIAVHHTLPMAATGYVEYGSNGVGSISCFPLRVRAVP